MGANGDNNRDAFQLDRLFLFSDAVFAIAITRVFIPSIPVSLLDGPLATFRSSSRWFSDSQGYGDSHA